jgi:dUTP pyrophosphatase
MIRNDIYALSHLIPEGTSVAMLFLPKITINGKKYTALLDTGSTITVTTESQAKLMKPNYFPPVLSTLVTLVDGRTIHILGKFLITITFDNHAPIEHEITVIREQIGFDLLIGQDLFKRFPYLLFDNQLNGFILGQQIQNEEIKTDTVPVLKVSRTDPDIPLPVRVSSGAAGFDVHSSQDIILKPYVHQPVEIGLCFQSPPGSYLRIAPRSGLAFKHGIVILGGVCDRDFTGQPKIIMLNTSKDPFQIKRGDRIVQVICEKIYECELQEMETLPITPRGAAGLGSSGVSPLVAQRITKKPF